MYQVLTAENMPAETLAGGCVARESGCCQQRFLVRTKLGSDSLPLPRLVVRRSVGIGSSPRKGDRLQLSIGFRLLKSRDRGMSKRAGGFIGRK
jgi:hypothetical protein